MHAPATAPQPITRVLDTLGTRFTIAHENWMADGDEFLLPVADADASFWERPAAIATML